MIFFLPLGGEVASGGEVGLWELPPPDENPFWPPLRRAASQATHEGIHKENLSGGSPPGGRFALGGGSALETSPPDGNPPITPPATKTLSQRDKVWELLTAEQGSGADLADQLAGDRLLRVRLGCGVAEEVVQVADAGGATKRVIQHAPRPRCTGGLTHKLLCGCVLG